MQPMQGFSPGRQIARQNSEAKTKDRVQLNKSTDTKSMWIETLGHEQLIQR